jgi:hypothetical protein
MAIHRFAPVSAFTFTSTLTWRRSFTLSASAIYCWVKVGKLKSLRKPFSERSGIRYHFGAEHLSTRFRGSSDKSS